MTSSQKLAKPLSENTSNASNNIISFSSENLVPSSYSYKDILSAEKPILFFVISLIYLFSALEEADWNILSSDDEKPENVYDNSLWNIYELIKR